MRIERRHPARETFVIFFARVAAKFFDAPIRTKIRRYSLQKRNVQV
jgi:hypothetical protein